MDLKNLWEWEKQKLGCDISWNGAVPFDPTLEDDQSAEEEDVKDTSRRSKRRLKPTTGSFCLPVMLFPSFCFSLIMHMHRNQKERLGGTFVPRSSLSRVG